ncbi:MAG: LamG domain-containing protein [Rhodospirillaceae bacterium]|nr:LamG domain-containing protein [Rhodospirillaceae bacterium]
MNVSAAVQRMVRAVWGEARRDEGVVALVIAIALIALAGATIATLGSQNAASKLARQTSSGVNTKIVRTSIQAYLLSNTGAAREVPCPDADLNGSADEDGGGNCTTRSGVLPWSTLGISQDDAIDGYGNYYTYVVTDASVGTPAQRTRTVCNAVQNSYDTSQSEYTGTLITPTDTESLLTSQTAGQGSTFHYALISHGANGLGAINRSGQQRSAPTSTQERQNCPSNTGTTCTDSGTVGTIYSGPISSTTSTYFDDTVYVSTTSQFEAMCAQLTPAGKVNAFVNESFDGTATGSVPTSISGDASSGASTANVQVASGSTTDKVLRFTGVGANAAAIRTTSEFNPAERPLYFSFEWRPTTLGQNNQAGISIATRATTANRGSGNNEDIFTSDGLTIRYYEDTNDNANGATANSIYICDSNTSACDSGSNLGVSAATFTITNNQTYTVEAYDDGNLVWARITQVGTPANTAFVNLTTVPIVFAQRDFAEDNFALIVNHENSVSELDDLLIGRASMGVAFDGSNDVITAGDNFDTTTGNVTLEAWVRPDTLPTASSTRAAVISKWQIGAANSAQAYRVYFTLSGLQFSVAGLDSATSTTATEQPFAFDYVPTLDKWTHIAVNYEASSKIARLYINGELSKSIIGTLLDTAGVASGATASFTVGAGTGTSTDNFDGDIADVRVWNTVRSASQILANYKARLQLTSGLTGLIVNWPLDRDASATFTSTTATATAAGTTAVNGTLTNGAAYIAVFQNHLPPFSTSFCTTGSGGTVVGAYQCDYRTTTQSGTLSIPNNLGGVHVKAWGAGGGGYDFTTYESNGGGGGYAAARLTALNTTTLITGLTVNVVVGGGGTASGDDNNGSGGGAASGLWQDTVTDRAGVIAGGGGGASFGDDNLGGGLNCNNAGDCGPGGGGGGPGNIDSSYQAARAADDGDNECSGRAGHNTSFTGSPDGTGTDCAGGGTDPTTTDGAGGAGAAGGTAAIGAAGADGGAGFNGSTTEIGAGGAGGGVRESTVSFGGGEAGGYDVDPAGGTITGSTDGNATGFGGGGGAGFADDSTTNTGFFGAVGTVPTPGGTDNPDYAPSYCSGGTNCVINAGSGGQPNPTGQQIINGRQGLVVIKW